jgi:hypothetical protein
MTACTSRMKGVMPWDDGVYLEDEGGDAVG